MTAPGEGEITPIGTRGDFQRCVRAAFAEAAQAGCRELWLADADFAAWPLGERAVVDALTRWVGSTRSLHLFAANFDRIVRLHPRWVEWRRSWSHRVECRTNSAVDAADVPTLLIAPGLFSLCLFDPIEFRGRLSREAADRVRDRERLDAVLQQSVVAFPAEVSGL